MTKDRNDELEDIVREVKGFGEEVTPKEAAEEISENVEKETQKMPLVSVNADVLATEENQAKEERIKGPGKGKKRILGICIGAVILLGAAAGYTAAYSNIHPGIRCEGVSLSGKTLEQAETALQAESDSILQGKELQIQINGKTYEMDVASVTKGIDEEQSAQNAYDYTHSGAFPVRISHAVRALFGGVDVPMAVTVDSDKIQARFEEISEEALVAAQPATYEVQGDQLMVTMGKDGIRFDQEKTLEEIKEKISVLDFTTLEVDMITEKAPELDLEQMKQDMDCEPENAKVNTEDGVTIIPEKDGVTVDLDQARKIIGSGKEETYSIPVTLKPAEITAEKLKAVLFVDTLGTATTNLNAGQKNRTSNVRLSAELINGTVLNPGDQFSYNAVVGPRTEERGFKNAMVFQDGGVTEGLGGGICQTSSTLYMSVLRADLEVTERRNHTFVVSYTPMGQDATVVYGSQDFKFVNNTEYPVKILASQSGSSVTVTLKGTKTSDKAVELSYVINSKTAMGTVEKVDKTLKPGQTRTEGGYTGYNVTVYKTVTENGVSEKSVANTSKYSKKDRVIYKGPEIPAVDPNSGTGTTGNSGNTGTSGGTVTTPDNSASSGNTANVQSPGTTDSAQSSQITNPES